MSDLVFVWLDEEEPTCFGTLVEIGFASAIGRPLYLATPHKDFPHSLWFAVTQAQGIVLNAPSAKGALLDVLTGKARGPIDALSLSAPWQQETIWEGDGDYADEYYEEGFLFDDLFDDL
jgi:hypothetical protein